MPTPNSDNRPADDLDRRVVAGMAGPADASHADLDKKIVAGFAQSISKMPIVPGAEFPSGNGKRLRFVARNGLTVGRIDIAAGSVRRGLVVLLFTLIFGSGPVILGIATWSSFNSARTSDWAAASMSVFFMCIAGFMFLIFSLLTLLFIFMTITYFTRREVWIANGVLHSRSVFAGLKRDAAIDKSRIERIELHQSDKFGNSESYLVRAVHHPLRPRPGKLAGRPLHQTVADVLTEKEAAQALASWLSAGLALGPATFDHAPDLPPDERTSIGAPPSD